MPAWDDGMIIRVVGRPTFPGYYIFIGRRMTPSRKQVTERMVYRIELRRISYRDGLTLVAMNNQNDPIDIARFEGDWWLILLPEREGKQE